MSKFLNQNTAESSVIIQLLNRWSVGPAILQFFVNMYPNALAKKTAAHAFFQDLQLDIS